jgi:hypothetical protein
MTPEALWFPIVKQWLKQHIPRRQTLQIMLDRTQWHGHNLIMVSFVYQNRAIRKLLKVWEPRLFRAWRKNEWRLKPPTRYNVCIPSGNSKMLLTQTNRLKLNQAETDVAKGSIPNVQQC